MGVAEAIWSWRLLPEPLELSLPFECMRTMNHTGGTSKGDFFAEPAPDLHITEASEELFHRKQEYEHDRLAEWLG
jgi:hypothetical protein